MSTPAQSKEAKIDVHWKEEPLIEPPASFVKQANAPDKSIYDRFSEKNFPQCFDEYAEMLSWEERSQDKLDTRNTPN